MPEVEAREPDKMVSPTMHQEDPTLRISIKGKKPSPRIVYRYGREDGKIKEYRQYRKFGRLVKFAKR